MFMISKFMYQAVFAPSGFLKIDPYEEGNHIANFYYFRLGALDREGNAVRIDRRLTVQRNEMVTVYSLEKFSFSERILGLFGNHSTLVRRGVQLVHGVSVDPGFTGSLAVALRNNSSSSVELEPGERIGKILFFDVSDSMINAEEFLRSALKATELQQRDAAAEKILQIYADLKKPPADR